ncbi:MAG: hypothetical protein Q9180_009793 [Flavoplaca navasiana]
MVCQSCHLGICNLYGEPSNTKEQILWDILAQTKHDLLLDYIDFRNLMSWRVRKMEALLAVSQSGNEGEKILAGQKKLQKCAAEFEKLREKVAALQDRFV